MNKVKTFQALKRSVVADRCQDQNEFIIKELCKLTYLRSVPTQNHWIRNLVGSIIKYSKVKVQGGTFNYGWFFMAYGNIDEDVTKAFFNNLESKYDNIKPDLSEVDWTRLGNNVNQLWTSLAAFSGPYGKILSADIVKQLVESLDLYKE